MVQYTTGVRRGLLVNPMSWLAVALIALFAAMFLLRERAAFSDGSEVAKFVQDFNHRGAGSHEDNGADFYFKADQTLLMNEEQFREVGPQQSLPFSLLLNQPAPSPYRLYHRQNTLLHRLRYVRPQLHHGGQPWRGVLLTRSKVSFQRHVKVPIGTNPPRCVPLSAGTVSLQHRNLRRACPLQNHPVIEAYHGAVQIMVYRGRSRSAGSGPTCGNCSSGSAVMTTWPMRQTARSCAWPSAGDYGI